MNLYESAQMTGSWNRRSFIMEWGQRVDKTAGFMRSKGKNQVIMFVS